MADEAATSCTVETPSRLLLFYPDNTPTDIVALLPSNPLCKPVGHQVTMGRSSSADVRLNDERMSRLYAALWHDGKDPFVFRVSNLSERKPLLVDGVMLRHGEEAEVKDGCVLTLDFLQFKARVWGGDIVAFSYQISFVKNAVMSPVSERPPEGKILMPRQDSARLFGYPRFPCSDGPCSASMAGVDASGKVLTGLINTLRRCSLDSGDGKCVLNGAASIDDVGVEYELEENVIGLESSPTKTSNGFSWNIHSSGNQAQFGAARSSACPPAQLLLNIPSPQLQQQASGMSTFNTHQARSELQSGSSGSGSKMSSSSVAKDLSCWFNLDSPSVGRGDLTSQDQPGSHTQSKQPCGDNISVQSSVASAADTGTNVMLSQTGKVTSSWFTLADMVARGDKCQKSPVENTEWDTDDPSINCYM